MDETKGLKIRSLEERQKWLLTKNIGDVINYYEDGVKLIGEIVDIDYDSGALVIMKYGVLQ